MAHYILNNDGSVTEQKKKKNLLDHAVDAGKAVFNLPTTAIKGVYNIGKSAVENTPKTLAQLDAFRRKPLSEKAEIAGKTALSTVQNVGEGVMRYGIEPMIDAGGNIFGGMSDTINTKVEKMFGMHKGKSEKEVNREKGLQRKEALAQDTTEAIMKLAGKDEFYKDLIEDKSLVKTDNVGGQAAQQVGGQLFNLLLANKYGGNNRILQSTPYAVSAYGSGVQEAYQNGANWDEANRYGILNSAVETTTEWLTGGIPGMKGTKGQGLDKLAEKLIGEPLDQTSKSLSKALLKSGYKLVGENTEEVLSDLINPYLKQFTYEYNKNKDVFGNIEEANQKLPTAEDLLQTIIITSITTGVLEAPSTVSDIHNSMKNNNNTNINGIGHANNLLNNVTNNVETQNQVNLNENTQNNINLPSNQYVPQNGLKLPTKVTQNTTTNVNNNVNVNPLENLQEFTQKQQEIKENKQAKEMKNRIVSLEEQLENQGTKILEESEAQKEAMIEHFKEYLEENNITNPTQKDINDAIVDNLSYDNELDIADTRKAEKLYNQYAKEYMQEKGIPFNNDKTLKEQQLDIIKNSNPMQDDYHTGIRNVEDIKTLEETLQDSDYIDYDEFNPDLTRQDIENAIDRGTITVYSSYPIEEGVFVSPSRMEAESYSGNGKIYSKNVPIQDIAWIDPTQGQYARVEKNNKMVYNEDIRNNNEVNTNNEIEYDPNGLYLDSKEEYGSLRSTVTYLQSQGLLKKKGIDFLENGNYWYGIESSGFSKFIPIARIEIDGNEYLIDYIKGEFKNGSYKNTKTLDSIITSLGLENEYSNRSNADITERNSTESNDSIHSGEQTNSNGRQSIEQNEGNNGELKSSFSLPTKQNDKISMPMVKNNDVLKVEAKRIANQINKTGGFDLKQRSWVETSTESDALKGKVFIEDLDQGMIKYIVQSNKKSLDTANKHLDTYGYEKSLDYVNNLIQNDGLPKASDVALMQRMIQEAAKRGDTETVQNLIMDTAILGTDLGQATQALSMIKRLTPEGQLAMYTKLVERAKARGEKSFQNVEITPEMVQNILEAYNKDGTYDQDDLNARVEKFKQDLADQMKTTVGEKVDAWRYLSMLGNPKTHIRNMVSNVAMTGTIKVKNAMARTLETLLPIKERTKTWKKASQDVKEFSRETAINMKDVITGQNKYNEKSAIESKKQIFKNKVLEKLSDFNGNALEAEDWFFSKRAFQNTLEEYLTANGINTYEDIQNNPEIVEKGKTYAVEQAEIATFRQYSKLAAMINQFERKGKVGKVAVEALMPFKKTPINVAKAGVNYSPLGLIKTISYDAYQLKQGNINASQFIDNISQGMTGTGLTLLGYALAKAGILTGSGGDDKEDKYDKQLGNTGYSINVGGNSYSISWLSPVAMPLLVGSNAYEQLEEEKEWDMNVVSDTLAKTLDPLNEMSFMQGLTNALNSYGSGVDKWKGALESTGQNYVGQFFPTLFSQIASTMDDKKRSTKASSNSSYKFGEQTVRSIMYKIPGLRQKLEVATDIWGNEKEQSSNIIERAFESFIAPYSKTKDISTNLDKEIKRVYNETGEKGVIPSIPYSYVKYGGETYKMSANEYTKYKQTYGQKANKYLNELIKSNSYKTASDEMKAKMIDNMYDYAKAEANEEYFKGNNINYTSKTLDELNELKKLGINNTTLAEYVSNKTQVSSIRSSSDYSTEEKKKKVSNILTNSNLTNKQLSYLYGKYYSTEEKLKALSSANIPIKEFIKYDLTDFTSDYNSKGKAISGSREKKVINYVNSLKLSVAQKALLIKMEYNSYKKYDSQIVNYVKSSGADYLDKAYLLKKSGFNSYDKEIINYVKKHYKTVKEREEILKSLGFTVKNGRVY